MSHVPPAAEAYAIIRPSGDQAGFVCSPSPRVNRRSFRAADETTGTDAAGRTGQNVDATSPMTTTATPTPTPSHNHRRPDEAAAASGSVGAVTLPSSVAMNL